MSDITKIPTKELLDEMSDARRLHTIRLNEGNAKLAEFWESVIDKIERELKRRRKVK